MSKQSLVTILLPRSRNQKDGRKRAFAARQSQGSGQRDMLRRILVLHLFFRIRVGTDGFLRFGLVRNHFKRLDFLHLLERERKRARALPECAGDLSHGGIGRAFVTGGKILDFPFQRRAGDFDFAGGNRLRPLIGTEQRRLVRLRLAVLVVLRLNSNHKAQGRARNFQRTLPHSDKGFCLFLRCRRCLGHGRILLCRRQQQARCLSRPKRE